MPSTTHEHYTAVVNVNKVTHNEGSGRGDDRTVDKEVVRMTSRDKTLTGLMVKLGKHIALVEDDEPIL